MDIDTIGLAAEQRSDSATREIFVEAFNLVAPHMNADGIWISGADETLAYEAMLARFPELAGPKLFAVLTTIASVRESGRQPVA